MKNFADMIGNNIKLNIDAETDFVPTNRGEEKVSSGFNLEAKESEEKVPTMVYMPKEFKKKYDKFIKRYGNRTRSEMIVKMLEHAMDMIEKEDNIK